MRFVMSAGETVLASSEDFCEVEAEERDEIAESIEEVRGIFRDPGAVSAMADAIDGFGTDDEAAGGGAREDAEEAASLRS